MKRNKAVRKYLQSYAVPEIDIANDPTFQKVLPQGVIKACIALPVFDENTAHLGRLTARLQSLSSDIDGHSLLILVLNQPDKSEPHGHTKIDLKLAEANNMAWLDTLDLRCDTKLPLTQWGYSSLFRLNDTWVLAIDRFSDLPLPVKQGVGLARKIAADIALALYKQGQIATRWLHNIDADCQLPENYLAPAASAEDANALSALVFPYKHVDDLDRAVTLAQDCATARATALYELRLQAYVDGLLQAGSPYAYQTLGSCICLSLPHYAQCRGFPLLSSGEDFYLLNKLRKVGEIRSLSEPVVRILARQSRRTPFGTGPAVSDILQQGVDQAKIFYHPALFEMLSLLLRWFESLEREWPLDMDFSWTRSFEQFAREHKQLMEGHQISLEACVSALHAINFEQAIRHSAQHSGSVTALRFHLFCWFDGFKTLRWLHELRDHAELGMQNFAEFSEKR